MARDGGGQSLHGDLLLDDIGRHSLVVLDGEDPLAQGSGGLIALHGRRPEPGRLLDLAIEPLERPVLDGIDGEGLEFVDEVVGQHLLDRLPGLGLLEENADAFQSDQSHRGRGREGSQLVDVVDVYLANDPVGIFQDRDRLLAILLRVLLETLEFYRSRLDLGFLAIQLVLNSGCLLSLGLESCLELLYLGRTGVPLRDYL